MKEFLIIINFLIFLKLFLFWLWLWQLKEYHLGRFSAHFGEGQAGKKIISSFWRLKYPKFTKKIITIFLTGFLSALLLASRGHYFVIYFLIIVVPLFFQFLTLLWRQGYLKKARIKREQFKNLLVIGVTGSYGKTSTKEFLYEILVEKFGVDKVLKTKAHQNSEMGIAGCVLNELKPGHEIFIVEMGAYNRGGIKLLCDMAKPKIGILTGINEQHMATFGSLDNTIKAKYELIESLPSDGTAFFNGNNKYCRDLHEKTKIKKVLYGQNAKFFGEENILGAMVVAKELGLSDEEIQVAVKKIENKFPGIKVKEGINGLKIIDATYSANPDGVIANLEYLKTLRQAQGKLIIVMPCLIELGSASAEIHRKIGRKIAEVCDPVGDASRPYRAGLAIITTKDRFKELKEGFLGEGGKEEHILFLESPKEILKVLKSATSTGDAVLLESRVPKIVINEMVKQ